MYGANPLISRYNDQVGKKTAYVNNPIINNNEFVRSNVYQQHRPNRTTNQRSGKTNGDIIKELLAPQKIEKKIDAKILEAVKISNEFYENLKKGKNTEFKKTGQQYKAIIKDDHFDETRLNNIKCSEDLIYYDVKANQTKDRDKKRLQKEVKKLEKNKKALNDDLDLEYNDSNKKKHKKKFEHQQLYIAGMKNESEELQLKPKGDYIDYYRKKQEEHLRQVELADELLREIDANTSFMDKNELMD